MEKNRTNTEKKDNPRFAFLPEMVIEHLSHSEPTELKVIPNEETSNVTLSQTIVFDPLADPFDGINIEIEPSKKGKNKIY